jgi:predicted CXXCH cytochrome family protein
MTGSLYKSFLAAAAAALLAGCGDLSGTLLHGTGARDETGGCLNGRCHSSVVAASRVHEPVAEGECAACHERLEGQQGHPDGYGPEFGTVMVRSPLVCFDCHDRANVRPMNEHKPWRMGHCRECHETHGSEEPSLLKRDVNGLCLYCHRDLAARIDRATVSHVTADQSCVSTCHFPHRSGRRRLLRETEEVICTSCHRISAGCGALVESDNARSGGVCTSCHYPHASVLPNMLKKNRFLPRFRR